MSLAVGISVCGWVPERMSRAQKLVRDIGGGLLSVSDTKEHSSVWWPRLADRLFTESPLADAYVFLNDDVSVVPRFVECVEAALEGSGQDMLSLHTSVPEAALLGPWVRCYWLTGPGYVMTRDALGGFLDWLSRAHVCLRSTTNEDNLIQSWRYHYRAPIWGTIPALVKHDVGIETVIEEHEKYGPRTTCVPYDDERFAAARLGSADYWKPTGLLPPIVENPYNPWPHLHQVSRLYDPAADPALLRRVNFRYPPPMGQDVDAVLDGVYAVPGLELEDHDRVLDIGANVGAFTRWAMSEWPDAEIVGYEPNREAARMFAKNCPITRLVNVAVTTDPGPEVFLYDGLSNLGESSLRRGPGQLTTGQRAKVLHPNALPPAALVKVDAEGSELDILGHYPHLADCKAVVCEWHHLAHVPQLIALCAGAGLRLVESDREQRILKFARAV